MPFSDFVIIFQGLASMLAIGVVGVMVRQRFNEVTKYFIYASFLAVCHNLGLLLELLAKTDHEMIYAVRVEYMGASFIGTFIFLFVATYCRCKIDSWFKIIIYSIDFVVFSGVWLAGHAGWYFKDIRIVVDNGIAHSSFEPGPFYYVFAFENIFLFFSLVVIVFRAIHQTDYMVMKQNYMKIASPITVPFVGYILYVTDISGEYDPTPAAIAIGCAVCCYVYLTDETFATLRSAHSSAYHNAEAPLIILDENYRYLESNTYTKVKLEEFEDLIIGSKLPAFFHNFWESGENPSVIEVRGRIYSAYLSRILEDDKSHGFVLVMTDITEANQQIEEMATLKQEAEDANNAKSAFLAQMSHEIRTPINSILGMNEMILRESNEKSVIDYAINAKNSAQALLRIINDILDVSKIESGKMELVPVEYDSTSMVFDVICMMKQRAEDYGLEFRTDIDNMLPARLYGDDIRIRQIIINLLSNAIKYTEYGHVYLGIHCVFQDNDVLLEVEVRDTGIGMKEEDIPKIFTAFQRVDGQKTRSIQGTGLGIHIVTTLLKLMNGELKVESEYGKGSCFKFVIRQRIIDASPIGNYESHVGYLNHSNEYRTTFAAPLARILVVDDNEMNRTVFRGLLKETEMKICEAESGYECLDAIQKQHFDMIFLDHMMPGMDGVETFIEMKKNPYAWEGTKVVMLTANALQGAKEEYMALGFDEFLSKPIDPEKLEGLIQRLLPKALVQVKEVRLKEKELQTENIDMPDLEEFDFKYAISVLKTKELLESTIIDFYNSLDKVVEELSYAEAHVNEEVYLTDYRIKVHALKSTSAMVGAMLLSKLARILEVAAIEGDEERIHHLHPVLLDEIAKHKDRMKIFIKEEEKKELPDIDEIVPMFAMLKNAIENNDYDTSDFLSAQVAEYAYPPEIQKLVEELKNQVLNLDEEEAIASCEEIGLLLLQQ